MWNETRANGLASCRSHSASPYSSKFPAMSARSYRTVTGPRYPGASSGSEAVEQDRALHVLDRLRDLDAARARLGAVEGRPAPEHAGLVRQDLQPLLARVIARVVDEAV